MRSVLTGACYDTSTRCCSPSGIAVESSTLLTPLVAQLDRGSRVSVSALWAVEMYLSAESVIRISLKILPFLL